MGQRQWRNRIPISESYGKVLLFFYMKQYERIQAKYEQTERAFAKATSHRRQKYWKNVIDKILKRKVTKQILQEQKELQESLKSVLWNALDESKEKR